MTDAADFLKETRPNRKRIADAVATLEGEGYRITKDPPKERASVKLPVGKSARVRLGLLSDTHLGSRQQQPTSLAAFYKKADAAGVGAYLHAGDMLDGLHVHRDSVYGQFAHGVDAQVGYAAKVYPRSANGPTYFIDGNHDAWTFENAGITSGQVLADRRPDLRYLGYYSAWVEVGGVRIYLAHGSRGGGAYGRSYKPQRLIEQMDVEDRARTDLGFFGHWHTDLYLGRYQGVFTWSLPCFQAQTRFLRSLGKSPILGALILDIEFDRKSGVWDLAQKWMYFDAVEGDHP